MSQGRLAAKPAKRQVVLMTTGSEVTPTVSEDAVDVETLALHTGEAVTLIGAAPLGSGKSAVESHERRPRAARYHRWGGYSKARKAASIAAGMALAGGAAYGATNWVVALVAGSSGKDKRRPCRT